MKQQVSITGLFTLVAAITAGCGESGPPMAETTGTVTYNGAPLEDASIVFVPDAGPPSTGRTDTEGRFTLNTRGKPGAVVGTGKVAIKAVEQLIEFKSEADMSSEDIANMSQSLIPEKYGHVMTSGLTQEVRADETNDWNFDLSGPVIKRKGTTKTVEEKAVGA